MIFVQAQTLKRSFYLLKNLQRYLNWNRKRIIQNLLYWLIIHVLLLPAFKSYQINFYRYFQFRRFPLYPRTKYFFVKLHDSKKFKFYLKMLFCSEHRCPSTTLGFKLNLIKIDLTRIAFGQSLLRNFFCVVWLILSNRT